MMFENLYIKYVKANVNIDPTLPDLDSRAHSYQEKINSLFQ